jgi:hypothetical protein
LAFVPACADELTIFAFSFQCAVSDEGCDVTVIPIDESEV